MKEDRKWACCHRIHELEQPFPVLSVVDPARSDEIVAARQAGVDDFICLPVRASELVCRVSVLIRHAYPDEYAGATLSVNDYEFSRFPNRVFFRGREIVLTAKEYELGRLFFEHIGRPVSRLTLAETVWQTRKKATGSHNRHACFESQKQACFERRERFSAATGLRLRLSVDDSLKEKPVARFSRLR